MGKFDHLMKHHFSITLLCCFSAFLANAQQKKDSTAPKKSHWVAGLTYQNNDVYLGRRDSIAVPYLSPSFGYHDKSGFLFPPTAPNLPPPANNPSAPGR